MSTYTTNYQFASKELPSLITNNAFIIIPDSQYVFMNSGEIFTAEVYCNVHLLF